MRATLRTALSSAVKWGYVPQNVAKLSEPRKTSKTRVEPLTLEQARQFLDAVWGDRMGMLFHVAIYTGMRQGELLGLTWDDVDLEEHEIHVRQILTWPNGKAMLTDPKTEQSQRTIGLGAGAEKALREQHARLIDWERKAARRWESWNLVFPNTLGKPQNPTNVTHRLQTKLEELKLPRQRFHDLRHLAASALIAEGADIHTVKELLGHSQITLTSNTYGHLTKKLAVDTAARMDRAFALTPVDPKTDPRSDSTALHEVDGVGPEKPETARDTRQDATG
ncbi:MAG: site-specific integrase [Thermomicrobiales bacterium]